MSADRIMLHCTERDYQGERDSLVVLLPKEDDAPPTCARAELRTARVTR